MCPQSIAISEPTTPQAVFFPGSVLETLIDAIAREAGQANSTTSCGLWVARVAIDAGKPARSLHKTVWTCDCHDAINAQPADA